MTKKKKKQELMREMKMFSEQINIDCVTREEISENLSQPGPNCFDRAQRLIYGLMENDCFPRFLKSEIYRALLEQQWRHTRSRSCEWLLTQPPLERASSQGHLVNNNKSSFRGQQHANVKIIQKWNYQKRQAFC